MQKAQLLMTQNISAFHIQAGVFTYRLFEDVCCAFLYIV